MSPNKSRAILGIAIIVVLLFLLYWFLIRPAVNSVILWWNLGYGTWFLIGIFIGLIVMAVVAIYVASR